MLLPTPLPTLGEEAPPHPHLSTVLPVFQGLVTMPVPPKVVSTYLPRQLCLSCPLNSCSSLSLAPVCSSGVILFAYLSHLLWPETLPISQSSLNASLGNVPCTQLASSKYWMEYRMSVSGLTLLSPPHCWAGGSQMNHQGCILFFSCPITPDRVLLLTSWPCRVIKPFPSLKVLLGMYSLCLACLESAL